MKRTLPVVFALAASFAQGAVAEPLTGRVNAGGGPVADSAVTLWAAGQGAPIQISQTRTGDDGAFSLDVDAQKAGGGVLYLIARGGVPRSGVATGPNPAIAFMATLGAAPPKDVTINELTTVASVWTGAQFLRNESFSGSALGLKIAAGNVPNLVDPETGGFGPVIQDPMNSLKSNSLATFATLGDLLAGCATRVKTDACARLYEAATPPGGPVPTDTLIAAEAIARHTWNKPAGLFALLDHFYPSPGGPGRRTVPFRPYLLFAPGAWTIASHHAGGGLAGLGGIAIDAEGNAWAANNQMAVSPQTMFVEFGGTLSKLAPNGRPISPTTTGFTGGGVDFPGWGLTIGPDGKVWVTSIGSKAISVFDRDGKPLSPDTGYTIGGRLGAMQGINVTPDGDVWAVDAANSQIIYMPKGDPAEARILCRTVAGKSADGTCHVDGPFHVVIDRQNRILVSNTKGDKITRFPADNPARAEQLTVGYSPHAMVVDSLGNVWVANTLGEPSDKEKLALLWNKVKSEIDPDNSPDHAVMEFVALVRVMQEFPGGSVSMIPADGSKSRISSFTGGGSIVGPWGITVDGDDHVWVANGFGKTVTELCGARTDNCPPGYKTGDTISPPKTGYVGKGMQYLTGIVVDPAGNVWVANNIDHMNEACFARPPDEALATRCGGNGFVEFYGLASR